LGRRGQNFGRECRAKQAEGAQSGKKKNQEGPLRVKLRREGKHKDVRKSEDGGKGKKFAESIPCSSGLLR